MAIATLPEVASAETTDERERGPHPRQVGPLVRHAEARVGLVPDTEDPPGVPAHGSLPTTHSATVRNPAFPMEESGVLDERAALRYLLQ